MAAITQHSLHTDHLLVPLTCGHASSVFDRSSAWDFPEEIGCSVCPDAKPTVEAMLEIQAWYSGGNDNDANLVPVGGVPLHPEIRQDEITWEEIGADLDTDPECWLKGTIVIAGVTMHLEAIEVVYEGVDDDGGSVQAGISPNLDEILLEYSSACGAEGHFQTMTRNGHEYAIFATPHCG